MNRTIRTDHRIVDGREFRIETIETMEYNGQWVSGGFKVTPLDGGESTTFIGWPTDSDIKNRS